MSATLSISATLAGWRPLLHNLPPTAGLATSVGCGLGRTERCAAHPLRCESCLKDDDCMMAGADEPVKWRRRAADPAPKSNRLKKLPLLNTVNVTKASETEIIVLHSFALLKPPIAMTQTPMPSVSTLCAPLSPARLEACSQVD